jgi:CheY-like chemotaxis protein
MKLRIKHKYYCFKNNLKLRLKSIFRSLFAKPKRKLTKKLPLVHPALTDSLIKLAIEADKLGANQIVIGHPFEDEYHFKTVNHDLFSGKVNQKLIELIKKTFAERTELTFILQNNQLYALNVFRKYTHFAYPIILEIVPALNEKDFLFSDLTLTDAEEKVEADTEVSDTEVLLDGNILLIENDEDYARRLFCFLINAGFKTTAVRDFDNAIIELRHSEVAFDLIISNAKTSGLENGTLIKKLKNESINTPIMILIPEADLEREIRIKKSGASVVINKQENLEVIVAWCNSLINKYV